MPPDLFEQVRRFAHSLEFQDAVNPVDGVTYPGISQDVPPVVSEYIAKAVAKALHKSVTDLQIDMQFWRLTTKYTPPAPHGAHNDGDHSGYAAFYYVNPAPGSGAGTALVSHKELGMELGVKDDEERAAWSRDTNNYDAWDIDHLIEWKPNRLAIVRADRMHRAEPPGGWGTDPTDGRLVLITFFS